MPAGIAGALALSAGPISLAMGQAGDLGPPAVDPPSPPVPPSELPALPTPAGILPELEAPEIPDGGSEGPSGGGSGGGSGASPEPSAPPPAGSGPAAGDGPSGGGGGGATASSGGDRGGATGEPAAAPSQPPSEPGPQARSRLAADPAAGGRDEGRTRSSGLPGRVAEAIQGLPAGVLFGLIAIAAIALLMTGRSAAFARLTRRLKLQRSELREDVGALQAALVPELASEIAGVDVSVAYRPASGPAAGGDFHDVFELRDGSLGLIVGDVAGHGREAVAATGIVRYMLRAYLEAGLEPRAALRLADEALEAEASAEFATAAAAIFDPDSGRLTFACAGHPPPLIADDRFEVAAETLQAAPIGIGPRSGTRQTELTVPAGTPIWFFTDGLLEARLEDGALLDREGLRELIGGRDQLEASDLLALVEERTARSGDDLTACALTPRRGGAARPAVETLEIGEEVDPSELERFAIASGLSAAAAEAAVDAVRDALAAGDRAVLHLERGSVEGWRVDRAPSERGLGVAGGELSAAARSAPGGAR